jgi:hypothetical protein
MDGLFACLEGEVNGRSKHFQQFSPAKALTGGVASILSLQRQRRACLRRNDYYVAALIQLGEPRIVRSDNVLTLLFGQVQPPSDPVLEQRRSHQSQWRDRGYFASARSRIGS